MANNGNLRDEDLFYIARFDPANGVPFGTHYQITWEHIRRRALRPGDQILVQSDGEYYHVAIGDYWSGNKTIDKDNDYFLVERRSRDQFLKEYRGLYYVQFEIPATVLWDVTGLGTSAGSADKFAFSYDITMREYEGIAPKLVYPDGTEHIFVPGQQTRIESNQLGVYRLEGTVQFFQAVRERNSGEVDFSLSAGPAWEKVTEHSTQKNQFGKRMWAGASAVTGIPAALKVYSCYEIFRGVGNIGCSLETFDTSEVTSFAGAFSNAGHSGGIDIDNWNVENGESFSSCFRNYKGDEVPNSWNAPKATKYQYLYTDAINIVGPVTWTGTILNENTQDTHSIMVEMFARCTSLVGPVHIPVLRENAFYGWWLNKMFEGCVEMVHAPIFANHPVTQPNAPSGTNAKYLNQAEFMFRNCHKLNEF